MSLQKLQEISLALKNHPSPASGLLTGTTGEAIFFAYLYLATQEEEHLEYCSLLVDKVLEAFEQEHQIYTQCAGFTGMAWGINHLIELGLLEMDSKESLDEINRYALQFAKQDLIHNGNWDYLHGALGVMTYILDLPYYIDYTSELEELLELLEEKAELQDDGSLRWVMPKSMNENAPQYSYGLSHGMPSLLMVFMKYYGKEIVPQKAKYLAQATLKNIRSAQFNDTSICYFPAVVKPNGEKNPTRLSWCYGDLSIALVLFKYAKLFEDASIHNYATEIALHTTTRSFNGLEVKDAGVCHGTIGNAFLFSKLYQETRQEIFKTRAEQWLQEGYKMASFEDGLAGFKTYRNHEHMEGYMNDVSLLEGISGIGLCLIHFLDPQLKTDWDKFLLLQ